MPVLGFGVYQRLFRPARAQVVTVMSANLAEAQREVSEVRTVADGSNWLVERNRSRESSCRTCERGRLMSLLRRTWPATVSGTMATRVLSTGTESAAGHGRTKRRRGRHGHFASGQPPGADLLRRSGQLSAVCQKETCRDRVALMQLASPVSAHN